MGQKMPAQIRRFGSLIPFKLLIEVHKQVNLTIYSNELCMDISLITIENLDMQIYCGDLIGEQYATVMKPANYTRVSNYIDWINAHSDFDVK